MARTPLAYARLLLILLLAVNIYRAATISITTDEAFTYIRSVSVPILESWKTFDANDHVLHTLLCKASVAAFGVSEFTLRIPALFGGVLLLGMCLRLSRLFFGDGWWMLLAFALLALNPLMLDYCSIARGYGMATALLLVALDQLLRVVRKPTDLWRLSFAGVALALGACANLTVVIPGTALTLAFAGLYLGSPIQERNWPRLRVRVDALFDRMIVPGIVVTVAILLVPLLPAKRENFYLGSSNWKDSLLSLVHASLWRPMNLLEHTALHEPVLNLIAAVGIFFPAIVLALSLYRWWRNPESARALLTLTGIATAALIFLLHRFAGMHLPERRTGLYLIPILTLLAVFAMEEIAWARHFGYLAATLTLALFLCCWNVRYYDEWSFDAGSRNLVEYLRDHAPGDGRPVTLYATFPLPNAIEFYRRLFRLEWLEVSRDMQPTKLFDVYLLSPEELPLMQKHQLTERLVQPVSNTTLATAPSSPLRP